jgi:hypothetical protein
VLSRLRSQPRHREASCPSCGASPVVGYYWVCDECQTRFDTLRTRAQCAGCGKQFPVTQCPECFPELPIGKWFIDSPRESSPLSFRADASTPPGYEQTSGGHTADM